jgi:hypothetical protein
MSRDRDDLTVLERRRIEAQVLGPVIRAFQKELGKEKANAIARAAIEGIAREQGKALRERVGRGGLAALYENKGAWSAGGALESEILSETPERCEFNVTRCLYAEMYRELGYADIGTVLSCGRDFTFAEGFDPSIELKRTQTIMEGAPLCDFRYRMRDKAE